MSQDNSADLSENRLQNKAAQPLRRGWTTGACATAATKSALQALLSGCFEDPVQITLPKGQEPWFSLTHEALDPKRRWAEAGITKDAGDDPDVTHGALICVRVSFGAPGSGLVWKAGQGIGTVTREGLPIPVGEASVTPVPRAMMRNVVEQLCQAASREPDIEIKLSIPGGEVLAKKTLNARLGVMGGLSILGTTGIVVPYSCASWIHSIYRGIDVARAAGQKHVIASTGERSETAAQALLGLPDLALLDMGDFAGAVLKYLHQHPIPRLTIAGGVGKLSKLAQGHMDLHSSRSQVDDAWLKSLFSFLDPTHHIQSAASLLLLPQKDEICALLTQKAQAFAQSKVGEKCRVEVMMFDRQGHLLARTNEP